MRIWGGSDFCTQTFVFNYKVLPYGYKVDVGGVDLVRNFA
ncbi:MAG: hypothetical protein ACI923_002874 [Flavobacteriales bacterium]|jgi:hypothetical protein